MAGDFSNKSDENRKKMVIYFNKVVDNFTLSRKIEQSIYNYIIQLAKEKNIQRKWENNIFTNLY